MPTVFCPNCRNRREQVTVTSNGKVVCECQSCGSYLTFAEIEEFANRTGRCDTAGVVSAPGVQTK